MKHDLNSLEDTKKIAHNLAMRFSQNAVLCLQGPLGAGKTTFAQFFLQNLLGQETCVQSPTFSLVNIYNTQPAPTWHMDLFRLKSEKDLTVLGWDEALHSDTLFLIEWPQIILQQLKNLQNKPAFLINITLKDSQRSLEITPINYLQAPQSL